MVVKKMSNLEYTWSKRGGGIGQTEREYIDIVIDGIPFSQLVFHDLISPYGWQDEELQLQAIDRLLGMRIPDLGDRNSFYVCPECGELSCGAVSMIIERTEVYVIWRDFGFQNNYENKIWHEGFEDVGPFVFEAHKYQDFFVKLRQDILKLKD